MSLAAQRRVSVAALSMFSFALLVVASVVVYTTTVGRPLYLIGLGTSQLVAIFVALGVLGFGVWLGSGARCLTQKGIFGRVAYGALVAIEVVVGLCSLAFAGLVLIQEEEYTVVYEDSGNRIVVREASNLLWANGTAYRQDGLSLVRLEGFTTGYPFHPFARGEYGVSVIEDTLTLYFNAGLDDRAASSQSIEIALH